MGNAFGELSLLPRWERFRGALKGFLWRAG
jgi:hypothetical protein